MKKTVITYLIYISFHLHSCFVKSQNTGIVLLNDTIVFELKQTFGGKIQWQERVNDLSNWVDIIGEDSNP